MKRKKIDVLVAGLVHYNKGNKMWKKITEDFRPTIGGLYRLRMVCTVCAEDGLDVYDDYLLMWDGNRFMSKRGMEFEMVDFDDYLEEES